eukprot:TRINITY_DN14384_c0_g1_i1.p1 TRINITY_DN14384_c0_g1~~TRINITY_DN14384_c0_g1_i1.p1  ORF type:complete len:148 (+),score=50.25 TRINITY_DN14384_c0_g1_i1:26-445(+)
MGSVFQTFKLTTIYKKTFLPTSLQFTRTMDTAPEWPNVFDACDSSSTSSSTKSTSQSSSCSMSASTSLLHQIYKIPEFKPDVELDFRSASDAERVSTYTALTSPWTTTRGPMLMSPPAEDQAQSDSAPHCTGCKSSSQL